MVYFLKYTYGRMSFKKAKSFKQADNAAKAFSLLEGRMAEKKKGREEIHFCLWLHPLFQM